MSLPALDGAPTPFRLAVVVSHPIQHFVPMYASLSENPALRVRVLFGGAGGKEPVFDSGFGRVVTWDLRLEATDHRFLSSGSGDDGHNHVARELSEFDPDGVLIYGYSQKLSRAARAWARRRGRRVLYVSDSERRQSISRWREWLKYPYVVRYLSGADLVMTVGDANEEYYRYHRVPTRKFVRTGFPIDVRQYREAFTRRREIAADSREALGLRPDDLVVLNVGKFVPWKRQEDLLTVLPSIQESVGGSRRVVVVLAGSGPDEARLAQLAESLPQGGTAVFAGFVAPEELPGLYAACDVYAHVSERDRHSLAVTEAAYMGCPIVVSSTCGSWGPTDDVRPGVNGIVYPMGNTEALSGALTRLLADPKKRLEFGSQSHQIAEEAQSRAHSEGWLDAISVLRSR